MAIIRIDLTKEDEIERFPDGKCLGHMGEHNVNKIEITPPTKMTSLNPVYYVVDFGVGEWYDPKILESSRFTELPIVIDVVQDLSLNKNIGIQVKAYGSNNDLIAISDKLCGFYFEEGLIGSIEDMTGTFKDVSKELYDYISTNNDRNDANESDIEANKNRLDGIDSDISFINDTLDGMETRITNNAYSISTNRNLINKNIEDIQAIDAKLDGAIVEISDKNNDAMSKYSAEKVIEMFNDGIFMTWNGSEIISCSERNNEGYKNAVITFIRRDSYVPATSRIVIMHDKTITNPETDLTSRMLTIDEIETLYNVDDDYLSKNDAEDIYQTKVSELNKIPYDYISDQPDLTRFENTSDFVDGIDDHMNNMFYSKNEINSKIEEINNTIDNIDPARIFDIYTGSNTTTLYSAIDIKRAYDDHKVMMFNKQPIINMWFVQSFGTLSAHFEYIEAFTGNPSDRIELPYKSVGITNNDKTRNYIFNHNPLRSFITPEDLDSIKNFSANHYTKDQIDNALASVNLLYPNRVYELFHGYSTTGNGIIEYEQSKYDANDINNVINNGGVFSYKGFVILDYIFGLRNGKAIAYMEYIDGSTNQVKKISVDTFYYDGQNISRINPEPSTKRFTTDTEMNDKQNKLISGTNIKTINGNSVLGNGDITISTGVVDYDSLENRPKINGLYLTHDRSFEDLGMDDVFTYTERIEAAKYATTWSGYLRNSEFMELMMGIQTFDYALTTQVVREYTYADETVTWYKPSGVIQSGKIGMFSKYVNRNLSTWKPLFENMDTINEFFSELNNTWAWSDDYICKYIKYVPGDGLYLYIPTLGKVAVLKETGSSNIVYFDMSAITESGLPDGGNSGDGLYLDSNGNPVWKPSLTNGNGIVINDNQISIDETVVAKLSDIPSEYTANNISYDDTAEYAEGSIGAQISELKSSVDEIKTYAAESELLIDIILNGSTLVYHDDTGYYLSDEENDSFQGSVMEVEY